jgi:hypothetical protein
MTGVFRLFSENGDLLAYARQKMFKMREDIRLYNDETQTQELLSIQARQIIDFSAASMFLISSTQEFVGRAPARRRSMMRDEWNCLTPGHGFWKMRKIQAQRALLRRLLLAPGCTNGTIYPLGIPFAEFDQNSLVAL